MLTLKILKGPSGVGESIKVEANKPIVLGRSDDADFQLASGGISKKHCQIREVAGGKLEVVDLGSSNGTFVNGLMIKKFIAKPGDNISLHDFVLRVEVQAPQVVLQDTFKTGFSDGGYSSTPTPPTNDVTNLAGATSVIEKKSFVERTIYPIADNIASQVDVRFLVLGFFIIWSITISCLSIFPFSNTSNLRIEQQASEVAKLYARQLARINQPFIIEHTYQKLISSLDQFVGQTPGVLTTMIVDASNGQILSPPDLVGRTLANPESVSGLELLKKVQDENGFSKLDSRGIIHALAPIRVGVTENTSDGTASVVSKVVAVSYVEMDATKADIQAADLMDGALSAVFFAILLGFIFVIMVYRWTEGSLINVASGLEEIIGGTTNSININTQWQTLKRIGDQINTISSRTGSAPIDSENSLEWAMATVESLPIAAAAFDTNLVVVSWNHHMENLIGIRTAMALGNDISAASRDVAFEGAIRDLSAQAFNEPGIPQRKKLDFSGREHEIVLVYSEGAHLVNIVKVEDG